MLGRGFAKEGVDSWEGRSDESDAGFDGAEERVKGEVPRDLNRADPHNKEGDPNKGANDGDEGDGY